MKKDNNCTSNIAKKNFKFYLQFNKLNIYYKIVKKNRVTKNKVAKSFPTILGIEKSKKINAYLSTNTEMIITIFFALIIVEKA